MSRLADGVLSQPLAPAEARVAALDRFDRWRGTAFMMAWSPALMIAASFEVGWHAYFSPAATSVPTWLERLFYIVTGAATASPLLCLTGVVWWIRMRNAARGAATAMVGTRTAAPVRHGDRVGRLRVRTATADRLEIRYVNTPWLGRVVANGALLAAAIFFATSPTMGRSATSSTAMVSLAVMAAPLFLVAALVNWSETWTISLNATSVEVRRRRSVGVPLPGKLARLELPLSTALIPSGLALQSVQGHTILGGLDDGDLGKLQGRRIAEWLRERGVLDDL